MGNGLMGGFLRGKSHLAHSVTGGNNLISPHVDSICSIFAESREVRDLFLEFLRKGDWIPTLIETSRVNTFRSTAEGFKDPEYILPSGSRLAIMDEKVNLYRSRSNSRSRLNSNPGNSVTSRNNSINRSLSVSSIHSNHSNPDLNNKDRTSKSKISTYQNEEIRSYMSVENVLLFIIAAAVPQFLKSSEFNHWHKENKGTSVSTTDSHPEVEEESASVVGGIPDDGSCVTNTHGGAPTPANSVREEKPIVPIAKPALSHQNSSPHKAIMSRSRAVTEETTFAVLAPRVNETETLTDLLGITRTAPEVETILPKLCSTNWLEELYQYLDNFPYAISVAAVVDTTPEVVSEPPEQDNQKPPTLQFSFVNKAFEKLTHFSRAEIVHKPFVSTLFPAGVAEATQIERLNSALKDQYACKLGITATLGGKKDSSDTTSFFNLMAMKPVIYHRGNPKEAVSLVTDAPGGDMRYVVAVHYNLAGKEEVFSEDLMAVDSVLLLLSALLA